MDITIVIPTHNRHEKLHRNLRYLDNKGIDIIVVDSSENIFESAKFTSVRYIHNSDYKFSDKIVHACELAKTNYICLCADDDFVLVEKLERLLAGLPNSGTAVIGSTVVFDEDFSGEFRYQRKINQSEFFDKGNSEDFFADYSQVLWGVYSTSVLWKAFSDIKALHFRNDNFIELYLSHYLIESGGIYRSKDFFSIREISPADHWGKRHKNLRQAYFENAEQTLIDLAGIFVISGSSAFGQNFAAYLGNGYRRTPVLMKSLVRRLKVIINRYFKPDEVRLGQVEVESLAGVREAILWKAD